MLDIRATRHEFPGRLIVAMGVLAVVLLSRAPSAAELAELWIEPEPGRDLFYGVGGPQLAPKPLLTYTVIEAKKRGFSSGYTVKDPEGKEWSAKLYPEARTEVVASRILWAVGYHQPPAYVLEQWSAAGARGPNPQPVARFRERQPEFHGLTESGPWAFSDNPFVGTKPLAGLLVLQVMLGNSDLKAANNMLYTLARPVEGARRWYVYAISATRSVERASPMRPATTSRYSMRRRSSKLWTTVSSSSNTAGCMGPCSKTLPWQTFAGFAAVCRS